MVAVAVAEARVRLMRGRHTTGPLTRACRHTCRRAYPGVGSPRRQEKSHAPRGAAASVNADARGSATIFASQASRGSQGTRGVVLLFVLRPHAGHHNERRRPARGVPRRPQDKTRRDMCDAVLGIGWQAGWLLRNDLYASVVEVLNFWTTKSWRVPLIS